MRTDFRAQLQATLGNAYTLEREIAGGGMGRIYVAHAAGLDRPVVVKVLPRELSGQVEVARFRREVRLVAALHHPRIVSLLSAGEANGLLYYTMPLVGTESLHHRLERERTLSIPQALRIARDIADALAFAHENGIVHRDVKPANILLDGDESLLADFGIARAVERATGVESDTITSTGMGVGTPPYMSPEQASGDKTLDGRSDLYSLGTVLYEMLIGSLPYHAPTIQALIAKIIAYPIPSLRIDRPEVPENVERIVHRCLAKSPADRYPTAVELGEALDTAYRQSAQ